jgi:transposase
MSRMTVLTGPERRRRWSDDERLKILTEAFSPGACVSEVARRHDVSTALIYGWRRKLRRELSAPAPSTSLATSPSPMLETGPSIMLGTSFAEAVLTDEPEPAIPEACAAIVIDLPGGGRVSIAASAPPALAAAALKALR